MPRKRLDDRIQLFARVDVATEQALKELAIEHGFVYGGEGSIGKLLDAIALKAQTKKGRQILALLLEND
jgi:hypothetical protein